MNVEIASPAKMKKVGHVDSRGNRTDNVLELVEGQSALLECGSEDGYPGPYFQWVVPGSHMAELTGVMNFFFCLFILTTIVSFRSISP